jgi:methionyl aminopeptidase
MSLIFKWIHRCTIGVLLLVFQNVICFRFKKSIVHHIPQTFPLQQARGFGIPICELPKVRSRCGKISPRREIPSHIKVPDYAYDGIPKGKEAIQVVPTRQCDIEKMRLTCKYAREVLDAAIWAVYKGIAKTTDDIDRIVHEECIKRNSYPSPLNYKGFPKSCCTSINEIMCHGIPDSTPLIDGDILNIDVTLFHDGVHGDCSETILVGNKTSMAIKQLIKTTFVAWQTAIRQCRPGVLYSSIGDTIESIIQPAGYSVGRDFAGHG